MNIKLREGFDAVCKNCPERFCGCDYEELLKCVYKYFERQEKLINEQIARLTKELKWYGHEIAGGGPMTGYNKAAQSAEKRWYETTLPLLNELGITKDTVKGGGG